MRFFKTIVAALAVAQGAFAVDQQKSIIVTFPNEVGSDVINRAMDEIKKAGGVITHEYNLIKGFAAKAPQKVIESMSVWTTSEYHATIEDDQPVQISNKIS
ncbi:hypothetical protein BKA67DRAFT_654813 [Truncatella angustata]|uniref:Uncharacterized protein n=1 Tax=Truncatella angustata TaxID=152316 RepID=A0A9P8UQF7_9PEZI|nr:uncharacterized protein BKA67DRAFT_654813 [Truncatella angustata]KAH6656474.1 hypothetical protein BKA67DRAFT_654813 [Truncatella angustata]KAH8200016.1 hypothetical protein TruAng_005843 [Truncatella angustata]